MNAPWTRMARRLRAGPPEKLRPDSRRFNRPFRRAGALLTAALAGAVPAALPAQSSSLLLPNDVAPFEFPLASSRTSAMAGRLIYLDRGESRFGSEWEGEAALGEVWPLLAVGRGRVPTSLHLGTEVYGRFSLGDAASAMISDDWQVTLILTADVSPRWRLALEGYHESSHLGDEYRDRFPVTRVNWSREILGLWASRRAGLVTLTVNGSYAAIDALNLGRFGVAAAADYRGKRGRVIGGGNAQAILSLNADAQEYTDWRVTLSGRAGIRFSDPRERRGFALLLTFLDGRSPQRQFYLERSRYYGMEVRFDL